jgi:hypothetical protein
VARVCCQESEAHSVVRPHRAERWRTRQRRSHVLRLWEPSAVVLRCTLSTAMAPTPRRSTPSKNVASDNATSDSHPTWNYAKARLPPFLSALSKDDYLYTSVPGSLSLHTRGYLTDPKGHIICENDKHLQFILDNPTKKYSFEASPTQIVGSLLPAHGQHEEVVPAYDAIAQPALRAGGDKRFRW